MKPTTYIYTTLLLLLAACSTFEQRRSEWEAQYGPADKREQPTAEEADKSGQYFFSSANDTETSSEEVEGIELPQEETTDEFAVVDTFPQRAIDLQLPQNVYHIVGGSFAGEAEARELQQQLAKNNYTEATVLATDGRFRVIVKSFADKDEARRYLRVIEGEPLLNAPWILTVE